MDENPLTPDYLEAMLAPLVRRGLIYKTDAAAIMSMARATNKREDKMDEAREVKPGYTTTELWLSVATAIISVLIAYGVLSTSEAEAWQALAAAVVPLALSIASGAYSYSRAKVKTNGW